MEISATPQVLFEQGLLEEEDYRLLEDYLVRLQTKGLAPQDASLGDEDFDKDYLMSKTSYPYSGGLALDPSPAQADAIKAYANAKMDPSVVSEYSYVDSDGVRKIPKELMKPVVVGDAGQKIEFKQPAIKDFKPPSDMPDEPALDPDALKVAPKTDGASGTRAIVIDTQAMKYFEDAALQLGTYLDKARAELAKVAVKPGTSGAGQNVSKAFNSDLKPDTEAFLLRASEALKDIADDMNSTAKNYETTEDRNGMTAADLSASFSESFAQTATLSETGKATTEGSGGGSGDGGNGDAKAPK